jgi:hypothetical protein
MAGVLKTRYEYGDDITGIAGAAVTAARLLKRSGGTTTQGKPTVIHTAAGTDFAIGAAKRDAALNDDITIVRRHTVMLLEAHAAIAAGAEVMPAAAGRVDTRTGAGTYTLGVALHATSAQGDFVWVLVNGFPGVFRPA